MMTGQKDKPASYEVVQAGAVVATATSRAKAFKLLRQYPGSTVRMIGG